MTGKNLIPIWPYVERTKATISSTIARRRIHRSITNDIIFHQSTKVFYHPQPPSFRNMLGAGHDTFDELYTSPSFSRAQSPGPLAQASDKMPPRRL